MKGASTLELLQRYESRNVTFIDEGGGWPMVWERARGVNVWDENGKKYLDLTAAFGVAAAGHSNPQVVKAGQRQMNRLLHAMGDVHPHRLKAELARELSALTFERWGAGGGKCIFGNSGFEAVEAALKTAMIATGKAGVVAFEGGYHGLGYGALTATSREHFRIPFRKQLKEFAEFAPFPVGADLGETEKEVRRIFNRKNIGAVLVEPIQGRGGIRVPPKGFLNLLRRICDEEEALLVVDEIYTGFGRTGRWFGCEHDAVIPDLVCLGKALTGGFPLSACVGRAKVMDAWPPSSGEAIHTSTFLGHPVGCAMALAQIKEIRRRGLVERSESMGKYFLERLSRMLGKGRVQVSARGRGLVCGVELQLDGLPATEVALGVVTRLLHRGFIVLPEGERGNVISFSPPLTIAKWQLEAAAKALEDELQRIE
jgi:4-aminobutyrate aminotransferase-like enzyme